MELNVKLLEILNLVLKNAKKKPISSINDNINLRNDLGLDSMALAELTVRIEEQFGIDVFEDGFVSTIGEIKKKLTKI
jgi:acyl carrier protein